MSTAPPVVLLVIASAAGLGLVLGLAAWTLHRRACRVGAERILRELSAMFAGEHEYRIVSEEEAGAAGATDTEVPSVLSSHGFRSLGRIEDTTITAVYPQQRAFVECFASKDGLVCARSYRVLGRQILDLGTLLIDGRFALTTTAEPDRLRPPPSVNREILPLDTPLDRLYGRHLERLVELRVDPARVRPCRTLDDAIAGSRLYTRIQSAHRRAIGYLLEEEMLTLGRGAAPGYTTRKVWQEFRRLRDLEGHAA